MRRVVVLGISVAAFAALAACQKKTETAAATGEAATTPPAASATAPTSGPPKRKPGLWMQTVSTRGVHQESRICIDAATDAQMSAWGTAAGKDACEKNVVTPKPGGGWTFEAVCAMSQGGTSTTTGEATGDFDSKYVVKAKTVTTGSSMPQANGTHEMELAATWQGPCPAGMKPGDMTMTLPGSGKTMTMNIADMMSKK